MCVSQQFREERRVKFRVLHLNNKHLVAAEDEPYNVRCVLYIKVGR